MPPLRSDPERLPHFFERLLGLYSPGEPPKLHRSAVEALRRYRWPGNVRELCWTAQRILLRGAGPLLREDDLRLGAGQCPT
jgi:DNA-binding NtrC family response regulator